MQVVTDIILSNVTKLVLSKTYNVYTTVVTCVVFFTKWQTNNLHIMCIDTFSAGTNFRRQNLISIDI